MESISLSTETDLLITVYQGTPDQLAAVLTRAHQAAIAYVWACSQLVKDGPLFQQWFGVSTSGTQSNNVQSVKTNFLDLYNCLVNQNLGSSASNEQISYILNNQNCGGIAGAWNDGISIGNDFLNLPFYGKNSQIRTLINLWLLGIMSQVIEQNGVEVGRYYTNTLGSDNCENLAESDPDNSIYNIDSYAMYAACTLPMNAKFDAAALLPNGKFYVTLGSIYIRYSDANAEIVDPGYPAPLDGNWGALPPDFVSGFDSMTMLPNGKIYVTKGSQYIRYSDQNATTIDSGYPLPLEGNWGTLPPDFVNGFDSMSKLPNGKIYVTKGNQYIRYSDQNASTIDSGYPAPLNVNWGALPSDFVNGFDTIFQLPNGKIYVTKGSQYIRYSDQNASTIDSGYPLPLEGNWGNVPQ